MKKSSSKQNRLKEMFYELQMTISKLERQTHFLSKPIRNNPLRDATVLS